jgi:hypothetical protein
MNMMHMAVVEMETAIGRTCRCGTLSYVVTHLHFVVVVVVVVVPRFARDSDGSYILYLTVQFVHIQLQLFVRSLLCA